MQLQLNLNLFCSCTWYIDAWFLLQSIKAFGFHSNLVDIVIMLYKDINRSVMINFDT